MVEFLRARKWYVKEMHASLFLAGVPDLFCSHLKYGHRWIEVKVLETGRFTPAQVYEFHQLSGSGSGIWVLVDSTEEEYAKLFQPQNWLLFTDIFRQARKL
jgi:hypothetical protein